MFPKMLLVELYLISDTHFPAKDRELEGTASSSASVMKHVKGNKVNSGAGTLLAPPAVGFHSVETFSFFLPHRTDGHSSGSAL